MNRGYFAPLFAIFAGAIAAAACSSAPSGSTFAPDAGSPSAAGPGSSGPTGTGGGGPAPSLGSVGDAGPASTGGLPVATPSGPVTDFPAPILDGNAPPNAAALFGPMSQGAQSGGPCLVEPETDVLYPQNWLRPRFTWRAANGETLFELRLHVGNQLSDLVVYSTNTQWTMPKALWDALRTHSPTEPMTLTVRGGVLAGGALQSESLGTQTTMGVAPVQATGAIVYWTTNDATTGTAALKGFSPGDESVEEVLDPKQFNQAQSQTSQCIGCHTSTPDGEYAAFTTTVSQQSWTNGLALIDPSSGTVGSAPSYLSTAGTQALARWNVGGVAFSPAHWATGDRKAVVSFDNDGSTSNIVLSWVDVEATDPTKASGILARGAADTQLAGAPTWSHDGATVAYTSTNRICTGRLGNCTPQYNQPPDQGSRADLFTVPFNGGAGGDAAPIPGASDPAVQESYPAYSPDDAWILYNRMQNDLNLYSQPASEVYVIAAKGGTPTRLAANDPPACGGKASPGITNSWGKWGPVAQQANGSTYYWAVFSSKRDDAGVPQLYMTSIVQQADGSLASHGAIYLWNQPPTEANHTPAWDTFKVPPIPAPK